MGNEVCGKNVLCNIILDSQQNMVRDRYCYPPKCSIHAFFSLLSSPDTQKN